MLSDRFAVKRYLKIPQHLKHITTPASQHYPVRKQQVAIWDR